MIIFWTILLNIFEIFFHVTTRKYYITYVANIFLLDNADVVEEKRDIFFNFGDQKKLNRGKLENNTI